MAVVDGNVREHLIHTFTQLSKLINITPDALVDKLLEGLLRPPDWSTVRVNTLKYTNDYLITNISSTVNETYTSRGATPPNIVLHDKMEDVLCIANVDRSGSHFVSHDSHVIVDVLCGCAVLRGAEVFAPGVMGAPRGIAKGDKVSVYADIDGKCLKGLATPYTGRVALVGNGVALQNRSSWFGQQPSRGVAIQMTNPLYVSPSLSCNTDLYYPQNLPSSLVSHVLDPSPGDLVLDMCAAPGGKTIHIASLMGNRGCVIAIDRNVSKVAKLSRAVQLFANSCVRCFAYDSTKLVKEDVPMGVVTETPPPYSPESFDKILLDGPCSGLGQRPLLRYNLKLAELLSYQQYQRQLIKQAVLLLKPGGTLVYSTCTVTPQENEEQVVWILEHFSCMQLVEQVPYIGYQGLPSFGLDEDQCGKLQRFGPKQFYSSIFKDIVDTDSIACDTIGFFVAKFVKK